MHKHICCHHGPHGGDTGHGAHDGGAHTHGGDTGHGAPQKQLALLCYMLGHNKQHAGELAQLGSSLSSEGYAEASKLIGEAAEHFGRANAKLEKAIGMIKKDKEG